MRYLVWGKYSIKCCVHQFLGCTLRSLGVLIWEALRGAGAYLTKCGTWVVRYLIFSWVLLFLCSSYMLLFYKFQNCKIMLHNFVLIRSGVSPKWTVFVVNLFVFLILNQAWHWSTGISQDYLGYRTNKLHTNQMIHHLISIGIVCQPKTLQSISLKISYF